MSKLAHYTLQENSGDAQDYSGNNYTGSVSGATQGETGLLGATAYSFDGTDDYIQISNTLGIFDGSEPLTITCWIRHNTAGNEETYFGPKAEYNWSFQKKSDDTVNWGFYDGTNNQRVASNTTLSSGNWYYLTGTWKPSSSTLKIYIDGAEDANATTANNSPDTTSTQNSIGNLNGGNSGSKYVDGKMADVRIYNRTLTPSEIQYLYQTTQRNTFYTETKTSDTAIRPNVEITGSLNGNTGQVYVIGSPETNSEEVKQTTLTTGETRLNWSNTHSDFAVQVITNISDITTRVEIDKIMLST